MSGLSTHVLDTSRGRPAQGLSLVLEFSEDGQGWNELHRAETNADGRVPSMLPAGGALRKGFYRLTFQTEKYFAGNGTTGFYPHVCVVFRIDDPAQHYHVPLLLSPFGYSTYRGS
jgi:5-hydroxyisourate hydrolase